MLLQQLNEYGYRLERKAASQSEAIPSDYMMQTIPWIIDLHTSGEYRGLVRTASGESRKDKGKKFSAPYLRRSGSKVKPQLLADKAEFVIGLPGDEPIRAESRHRDFVRLVRACAKKTREDSVSAVARFLENKQFDPSQLSKTISHTELVTFRVGDTFPINLPSVQEFWRTIAPALAAKGIDELTEDLIESWLGSNQLENDQAQNGECLICGKACQPTRVHPVAIKLPRAVADQQCSIVTANKDAFLSYGLEQSLIAPTCRPCAQRYARAVNDLVVDESTHITVGPLVYVFWTRDDQPFSIVSLLSRAEPGEVRALLNSAFTSKESATHIKPSSFFATAFSASGGRVVVRDWLETTVERAKANLARWFTLQAIIGEWGEPDALFFPIQGYLREDSKQWVEGLAECLVPQVRRRRDIQDVNPNVPRALIRLALTGGPLPSWLLSKAVRRNVCEQGVTRSRAALIKMVLLSSNPDSVVEGSMEKLDPANNDPALLCGRLLAVLEAIQREAVPGVKATITDRFFGTASSAPASVFGRLIRGSQPHLAKLRKDRRAASEALQKRLEEIIHPNLRTFPRVLTLEQQGIFALGYYYQRAEDRAAAMARKHGQQ